MSLYLKRISFSFKWCIILKKSKMRLTTGFEQMDHIYIYTYIYIFDFRRGIALAYLNGPIYAVGGLDDMACFNTVERYDPESDSWSMVQPLNFSRGGVAVVAYRVRFSDYLDHPHHQRRSCVVTEFELVLVRGFAVLGSLLYLIGCVGHLRFTSICAQLLWGMVAHW